LVELWHQAGNGLLYLLLWFYHISGDYGVAIILLTLVVRAALYPLSHKQLKSMQAMQKLQPRIKVLQEKYKDDRERLNKELMALYKEHNANPAAGCLTLLPQIPILILLFRVLMQYNFDKPSFLFPWIPSLSKPDPYYILVIAIGIITYVQQKVGSPSAGNPQMKMMNYIMPFFMVFITYSLPSGVLVYWFVSSVVGIAQQYYVMKKVSSEPSPKVLTEPPKKRILDNPPKKR